MDMQTTGAAPTGNLHDDDYENYLQRVQDRYVTNTRLTAGARPLFTTDAADLFDVYLLGMEREVRQYHNCDACKRFINRYGGLVTINANGALTPAIWHAEDTPDSYAKSIANMRAVVMRAKITGVFLAPEPVWGQPETGIWKHFAILPCIAHIYGGLTKTAGQAAAEKKEDYLNVVSALDEFPMPLVHQAVRLLSTEVLYRREKVLGQAQWLLRLHLARNAARKIRQSVSNVVWEFVATAPEGFCHPKSSMIGSLLEDLAQGMDFGTVSDRWAKKMNPTQYQRPQTAPAAGTIRQAEKIFEQLQAAGSIKRRFARLDDLRTIWEPKIIPPPVKEGVFGHLKSREGGPSTTRSLTIPVQTMTWTKFKRDVLPTADSMLFYAAPQPAMYAALMTAAEPEAPPILQWDTPEFRNPVSWYVWQDGSTPQQFGLAPRAWHRVKALTLKPSSWNPEFVSTHHGEGLILILEGAVDTREGGGIGLFPEILKSEFHGIRSVLEAFSKSAVPEDTGGQPAAGLLLQKGVVWSRVLVSVITQGQAMDYVLDRWE